VDQFRDRPMLICWGCETSFSDRQFLAEWSAVPGRRGLRFPDCGHYVLEDATGRDFAAVRRFLTVTPFPRKGAAHEGPDQCRRSFFRAVARQRPHALAVLSCRAGRLGTAHLFAKHLPQT